MAILWKYGLLLGILVAVWTYVMGFAGWFRDPVLLHLFWLVVVIQTGVLLLAMRSAARVGAGYMARVGTGIAVSAIAGTIIFASSLLFSWVVFPDHFKDLRVIRETRLRDKGKTEEEIHSALAQSNRIYTPSSQAAQGYLITLVTGVVVSFAGAPFTKKKSGA
jgi:multidrug transporter EmrE-like cation transporter